MQNNRLNSDAIIVLVILIILLYNLCRTKWIENRLWNRSFNPMFSTTSVMRFVFVLNIVTSHVLTVTDKNWARCIFPFLPVLRSCTVRLSMSKKDFNRYKAFYLFEYALASVRTSAKFSFVTNSFMLIFNIEQCPGLNNAISVNDQYVHVLAKEPLVHGDKS